MANFILTLEQYAKQKGVTLKTVYNWINSGKVKPTIIGKHKFITEKK
jgi:predicted site-specific integrase-resolvase